ncbi:MAG: hypothetical protein CL878_13240 [Dehalococcoidia bacterium]|nr:hypothetical protein [Dehalococcoidia bacterium]
MQLGYSTWGMPTEPADVAIPYLAKLGFEAIELTVISGWVTELSTLDDPARRAIRQLYADYQVDLPAIAGHTPLIVPEDEYQQNLTRLQATVDLAVDLAGANGPPPLNTTIGGTSRDWEQDRGLAVERLGELVRYGQSRGVVIAVEPHVGNGLDTPARTLWMLDQIASPWLKVNFDISHFNVQGMSIEETVPPMAPVSVHTHVKDERGVVPNFEFLIPGEGEMDYLRYLKAMDAAGYTGSITVEISKMVHARPNYDPLAAARQSYDVLNAAWQEAGLPHERDG